MTPDEARGTAEGLAELGREANLRAAQLHGAVSRRVYGLLPGSGPVRLVHHAIAAGVHGTIAVALPVGGAVAGLAAHLATDPDAPSVTTGRRAGAVLAAVSGAVGDELAATDNALARPMAVRSDGEDVPLRTDDLAAAHPGATGRVAVWLHGLCEDESVWHLGAARQHGDPAAGHPWRTERGHGLTPVLVRYNSGLRVLANGRALDRLLGDLVAAWPVPVTELVVVGHSMGGLVARSAALQAQERERAGRPTWLAHVRRIVCLGTPHHGAPLERGVHRLTHVLRRVGETSWVADLLDRRSVGIKDLRWGSVGDEWVDTDPDALLGDLRAPHADLDDVDVHAIVATLGRRPDDLVSRATGDLLVWWPSGTGEGPFPIRMASVTHLPRRHHFDLLNHPDAVAALDRVLGAGQPQLA